MTNNNRSESTILERQEVVTQPFHYLVVMDFEATCEVDNKLKSNKEQEIIEFPAVLLNTRTLEVESEFHMYVRPVEKPQLTKFCSKLTAIEQSTVDNGFELSDVLEKFHNWLLENKLLDEDVSWTTVWCGDWDLKTMLPNESLRKGITTRSYWKQWINVKSVFDQRYKLSKRKGMSDMLDHLDIPLTGHHHSGIADARNIVKIVQRLILEGVVMDILTVT